MLSLRPAWLHNDFLLLFCLCIVVLDGYSLPFTNCGVFKMAANYLTFLQLNMEVCVPVNRPDQENVEGNFCFV